MHATIVNTQMNTGRNTQNVMYQTVKKKGMVLRTFPWHYLLAVAPAPVALLRLDPSRPPRLRGLNNNSKWAHPFVRQIVNGNEPHLINYFELYVVGENCVFVQVHNIQDKNTVKYMIILSVNGHSNTHVNVSRPIFKVSA